jgi:hypothetical protein
MRGGLVGATDGYKSINFMIIRGQKQPISTLHHHQTTTFSDHHVPKLDRFVCLSVSYTLAFRILCHTSRESLVYILRAVLVKLFHRLSCPLL